MATTKATTLAHRTIPTSAITSGTFADGRIAASNVTQHEGSIDALASNPTITLGSNASGFTGVKILDFWRLSANQDTVASPLTSNLERVTTTDIGNIGSAMTVSSGIFTFPMTGIYLIKWSAEFALNNTSHQINLLIRKVVSGSDSILVRKYTTITRANSSLTRQGVYLETTYDVSDTSTHKIRFDYDESATATAQLQGNTSTNPTVFTFIRLGDA